MKTNPIFGLLSALFANDLDAPESHNEKCGCPLHKPETYACPAHPDHALSKCSDDCPILQDHKSRQGVNFIGNVPCQSCKDHAAEHSVDLVRGTRLLCANCLTALASAHGAAPSAIPVTVCDLCNGDELGEENKNTHIVLCDRHLHKLKLAQDANAVRLSKY